MDSSSLVLILDACIEDIRSGKTTLEECREQYPQQWSDLEPLLHLTRHLEKAHQVQVSPEYRLVAAARMRNLVAAYPRGSQVAWPTRGPVQAGILVEKQVYRTGQSRGKRIGLSIQRFLQSRLVGLVATLTVLLVMLLAGTMTAHASAEALPGETLYPLKTTIEAARLAMSSTEAGDARLHMSFAARRLSEATALLERNKPEYVERTLDAYVVHVTWTVETLEKRGSAADPEQEMLARLIVVELASQQGQLTTLLADVPDATQDAAESALVASREGEARILALVEESPNTPVPDSRVTATLALPAQIPTSSPTATAVVVPTATASPWPTSTPSPAPTSTPTATSTSLPAATFTPQQTPVSTRSVPATGTPIPFDLPTDVPKDWLTRIATRWPTVWPTAWPTGIPTAWPTGVPTAWPTGVPTAWPIEIPTAWPTAWPIPLPIPTLPPLPNLPPPPPGWP